MSAKSYILLQQSRFLLCIHCKSASTKKLLHQKILFMRSENRYFLLFQIRLVALSYDKLGIICTLTQYSGTQESLIIVETIKIVYHQVVLSGLLASSVNHYKLWFLPPELRLIPILKWEIFVVFFSVFSAVALHIFKIQKRTKEIVPFSLVQF